MRDPPPWVRGRNGGVGDYQVAPQESDLPRHEEENQQEHDRYRAERRSQSSRSHRGLALDVIPSYGPPYGKGDGCSEVGEKREQPRGCDYQTGGEQNEDWSYGSEKGLPGKSEVGGGTEGENGCQKGN